ncbi:MAG TPA: hypothetical protein ACFE0H_12705 [Elainellaceae cyanobacterium]|jgi:hypothetical protein
MKLRVLYASDANRLNPLQWVNVWQVTLFPISEYYATCQVQELDNVLGNQDVEEFALELIDEQGHPAVVEVVLP